MCFRLKNTQFGVLLKHTGETSESHLYAVRGLFVFLNVNYIILMSLNNG